MSWVATLAMMGMAGGLTTAPAESAETVIIETDRPVTIVAEAPAPQRNYRYETLLFCFAPGSPGDADNIWTDGIKFGAPMSFGGPVNGLEVSVLNSASETVSGIQTSIISNTGKSVEGLQFSIVNILDTCSGLQLGIFNKAKDKSFQIGLINIIDDGWCPFLPIINFQF